MSMLLDLLTQNMGGDQMRKLGNAIGANEQTTGNLLSTALPLMMQAMSRNAKNPKKAATLQGDLERDGQGSILANLDDFLDTPATRDDDNMVANLFGSKRSNVEKGLGALGGVDAGMVAKFLPMIAPVVMSMLGKASQQGGGASLTDFLDQEERAVNKKVPSELGMLGSLLDSDGDGQIADDLASMGGKLLGGLFGK